MSKDTILKSLGTVETIKPKIRVSMRNEMLKHKDLLRDKVRDDIIRRAEVLATTEVNIKDALSSVSFDTLIEVGDKLNAEFWRRGYKIIDSSPHRLEITSLGFNGEERF